MKDLKISDKLTVKLAEHLDDISIKRWTAIKQWAMTVQTGTDIPSLRKYGEDMMREFDNQSPAGMYRVHYDWLYGLSILDRGDDADQFIFALITLKEGEELARYEPDFIREKLNEYNEAGLTQGLVKKEVENFIAGVLKL